ncbi:TPA: fimbrial protein [Burkholderia territorii]|uniref:fimbrial protein n=1 Tax=Burkholderia territorii TaxID=1503055 RepID=UPI00075CBEA9|nr:fimbrial protein [Burkholderia territorii]KVL36212.1 fimbrial protein [Burkholderia territorii]KWH03880.1 fimbrial protein [Burkholderia territorii]TXG22297.1 fimbrial protein [Burkholderia territorii]HDR8861062.1 fimbrial protein [Burkholderia territorii]HDR8867185.1 fimbrial protein [Burkholderia territorii]
MNARTQSLCEPAVTDYFVCASTQEAHVRWLADTLISAGAVEAASLDPGVLAQRITGVNPALVFIDFSERSEAASVAAATVRAAHPGLPIIALGSLAQPESTLAALRAGVRDFIDVSAPAEDALRTTRGLLSHVAEPTSRHGKVVALLGARAGMGVSTLAANLSVWLQKRALGPGATGGADGGVPAGRQTALIDLGLPPGDGALFLNTRCEFHFIDAVQNLRRIDRTFVNTALTRHQSGVALTTLPPDLSGLRDVSYASCIGLLNRFRAFFDQQVVDLGGFTNREFVTQIAASADEAWLVCDQGVASIVSAADLLTGLRDAGVDTDRVKLVVNQYDPALDLLPAQIAERLGLSLVGTLPARRVAIGHAANQGRLIIDAAERDPYVRALESLATRLPGVSGVAGASRAAPGLSALKRFIQPSSKRS